MDLDNLVTQGRAIQVEYAGQKFGVTYRPEKVTRKRLKAHNAAIEATADNDERTDIASAFVVEVVKDWEVTHGGETVPLTVEAVEAVPISVLNAILTAIYSDVGETPKANRKTSFGG